MWKTKNKQNHKNRNAYIFIIYRFFDGYVKTKSKEKYIGIPLLEMQAKFLSFEVERRE